MKERREAEESRKNAERYEMQAMIAREQRTLELERSERIGKIKMLAAVTQFNKELVNISQLYLQYRQIHSKIPGL